MTHETELLYKLIEKQKKLISLIGRKYMFQDLRAEIAALKKEVEEQKNKLNDPNLCCICHSNYVDSGGGIDTCDSCLRNI